MSQSNKATPRSDGSTGCGCLLVVLAIVGMWYGFPWLRNLTNPEIAKAKQAVAQLDVEQTAEPSKRIAAIQTIRDLTLTNPALSGWQYLQSKGCNDPDPAVRSEAVSALNDIVRLRPDAVVKSSMGGLASLHYLDIKKIEHLGKTDPSEQVRINVTYLLSQRIVPDIDAMRILGEMAAIEKDNQVSVRIKEAIEWRSNE